MPRIDEGSRGTRPARDLTAVGITCGIGSMLVGARQAGFKVVGNIEWRRYYSAKDTQGRNTFLDNFPGAFMKYRVEDLSPAELALATGCDLAIGHPESFRPDVPVYTSRGWVPIGEVQVGDLVMTHRGRFRRVYRAFHYQAPPGTDEITFSRNTRRSRAAIVTTGNHPILMEDGTWRPAREVRKGESIIYLCDRCSRCGELTPISPRGMRTCYCGLRESWMGLTPDERSARTGAARAETRRRIEAGVHDFTDVKVRQKGQAVQGDRSVAERVIRKALAEFDLTPQISVGPYCIDLGHPGHKIAVEVDGGCWHRTERKSDQDRRKSDYLEAEGWTVVRVQVRSERLGSPAERRAIRECVREVRRLIGNHEGRYEFAAFKVGGLWRSKFEDGEPLCNLSVEEDESYVANGVVVHNCGLYSAMQGCNNFRTAPGSRKKDEKQKDPGDIPLFLDLINRLRPRYFVMDDLPKSFLACPMEEYVRRLPEYDLFPEWVSNWGYGNVQRKRVRMFMIGALRSERFAFRAGEFEGSRSLADVIGDLPLWPEAGAIPNHDPHAEDEPAGRALHMDYLWHRPTYGDYRRWMEARPEGTVFEYHSTSGGVKRKPGWYKQRWLGACAVVDGGSGHTHPLRNLPFTLRERARIQGFPDDFVFYGTKLNDRGEWNHERNIHMVKQTGKAMPVQFCRFASGQIAAAIRGDPFECSGLRTVKSDPYVSASKMWFCERIGYADQEAACSACWMRETCDVRRRLLSVGVEAVRLSPALASLPVLTIPAPSSPRRRPTVGVVISTGVGSASGDEPAAGAPDEFDEPWSVDESDAEVVGGPDEWPDEPVVDESYITGDPDLADGSAAGPPGGAPPGGSGREPDPVDLFGDPVAPTDGREVRASPRRRQVRQREWASVETDVVTFGGPDWRGLHRVVEVPPVNLVEGPLPEDYHCRCRFCSVSIGELRPPDGTYYSRLERRGYYHPSESGKSGHAAKTPLHLARWAVQRFTRPGDWVLDPTIGAGTTAVESLVQGRCAAGMELQYREILSANLGLHATATRLAVVGFGDARNLGRFLRDADVPRPTLVVNNPPYSGDEHWTTLKYSSAGDAEVERKSSIGQWSDRKMYDQTLPNLAFLREGDEYWATMARVYSAAADHLLPGGHFVVGVKDMMRAKAPFMLHRMLCELLEGLGGLEFVGTAALRHHPATLQLNTYGKIHGVEPPKYQTISVFQKTKE